MRYDLFDYQRKATTEALERLQRAREAWIRRNSPSAFALSAVPGAGKTVIATAVIEAMLYGSAEYDTPPDPKAVFLWITDSLALNRQTRDKMLTASHMLEPSRLVVLDKDYRDPELLRGNVYFLNIQKLSKTARFGRRGQHRRLSGWEIIANTIDNEDTDLYLVLDEAHRGMTRTRGRGTIVQRLISGQHGKHPPVPVVWGISATIARFAKAMENQERTIYPQVNISIEKVRASGLVKDKIEIHEPSEPGTYYTTLLRAAVDKTLEFERLWAAYSSDQQQREVLPVLVVQVTNEPSDRYLSELISVIEQNWPALGPNAIVNVFGEQHDWAIGNRKLRWVRPESIEEDRTIRVVLAKDAISTGWDCPRAEVLISDRPAKDSTHIAQVIGRMVRTPLAQRIATEDALNSVSCYLPLFDRSTLGQVIKNLTKQGEPGSASEVIVGAQTFARNANIDSDVFEFVQKLPSLPKPDQQASPLRRAKTLAKLLTDASKRQALMPDAGENLTLEINLVLDGLAARHADALKVGVQNLERLHIRTVAVTALNGEPVEDQERSIPTAARDIDRETRSIVNSVKEGIGKDYVRHLIKKTGIDTDILQLRTRAAALFKMEQVPAEIDKAATSWVQARLSQFDADIHNTTGDTWNAYTKVREQTSEQETTRIHLPTTLQSSTRTSNAPDAKELEKFTKHLFCNTKGKFPAKLNDWEQTIITTEINRPSFVAWYRNPDQPSIRSHRIGYCHDDGTWKSLQVDFLIISRRDDGTLGASIIDPHGDHLADSKLKLQALARFADRHGDRFVRIQSITNTQKGLRSLNLLDHKVRAAVTTHKESTVRTLYHSALAKNYK